MDAIREAFHPQSYNELLKAHTQAWKKHWQQADINIKGGSYAQKAMRFALALILAGALGNFIDRIFRGHVIDFLEVHVKKFYWPTFNIADSCISIGAVLLVFILVTRRF